MKPLRVSATPTRNRPRRDEESARAAQERRAHERRDGARHGPHPLPLEPRAEAGRDDAGAVALAVPAGVAEAEQAARHGRRPRPPASPPARACAWAVTEADPTPSSAHVQRPEPDHGHDPVHRVRGVAHREGEARDRPLRQEEESRRQQQRRLHPRRHAPRGPGRQGQADQSLDRHDRGAGEDGLQQERGLQGQGGAEVSEGRRDREPQPGQRVDRDVEQQHDHDEAQELRRHHGAPRIGSRLRIR